MPGRSPASPRRRSFVAPSSSNKAFRSSGSSVSLVRTLSSLSLQREGIKRCVLFRDTSERRGRTSCPPRRESRRGLTLKLGGEPPHKVVEKARGGSNHGI